MANTYPLSDEFMTYDYNSHRYILTQAGVLNELGINLIDQMGGAMTANVDVSINVTLNQISQKVYQYIYEHNIDNQMQQFILSSTQDGRRIIKEAMQWQLQYWLVNGVTSFLLDKNKRDFGLSEETKSSLAQTIRELGTTVLYVGTYHRNAPPYDEYGY